MEASVKSISASAYPGASTPSYTLDVTPDVGDWLLVLWTGEAAYTVMPSPPAGWTVIRAHAGVTAASTTAFGAYAKTYTSPRDLTWSLSDHVNTIRVKVVVGTGSVDPSNWVLGSFAPRATNATTTTAVAPSVTASGPGLAVSIAAERTLAAEEPGQIVVTGSVKFNEDLSKSSNSSTIMVLASKRVSAGEVTGPVTFTFPNTHANNAIAGTVVIPDAVDVVDNGMPVRMATTEGVKTLTLKVSTDSGLVTPKAIRAVSPGFGTVQAMLDTPQFKIAHRGGSVDFPEMSLYAYGQSALLGYNALELSLGRSSDGVIFGLHDETLLRTSGVDVSAASMTWAEIQKLQIFGSQPYMRFEELLTLYSNHVIFVDNKYIPYSALGSILDIMDDHGGPERFVYKYYGTTTQSTLPRSRGYKAWGYFYETNIPTLANWQGNWDILGMEYTGTQAAWDAIKSYGKPVVGHICPNLEAATMALNKGANGLMVSGVRSAANL